MFRKFKSSQTTFVVRKKEKTKKLPTDFLCTDRPSLWEDIYTEGERERYRERERERERGGGGYVSSVPYGVVGKFNLKVAVEQPFRV